MGLHSTETPQDPAPAKLDFVSVDVIKRAKRGYGRFRGFLCEKPAAAITHQTGALSREEWYLAWKNRFVPVAQCYGMDFSARMQSNVIQEDIWKPSGSHLDPKTAAGKLKVKQSKS